MHVMLNGALAAPVAAVFMTAAAAAGVDDSQERRISTLEAEVAALRAALNTQNEHWLTEQRADEIKGLVQDVLADADTRASLLQNGMTSGYDQGFFLSSADGNWLLRINFLMQQRFIWNSIEEGDDEGGFVDNLDDRHRYGFENTRSKLTLSGHVANPNWFYRLDVNFGSNAVGTGNFIDDTFEPFNSFWGRTGTGNAYLGYDYGNGWRVRLGTMKAPFLREELVEAQYQLAVERSIINYAYTTGYVDGIAFEWAGERFRVSGMFSDGAQTGQTLWSNYRFQAATDVWPTEMSFPLAPGRHAEYALTGRAEFLGAGIWEQFADFTSPPDGGFGALFGVAAHWQKEEYGTTDPNEAEVLMLTGDVSLEFGGATLYGAVVWSDIDAPPFETWNPWGFIVQGAFYLTDTWELFARYEWNDYDLEGLDDLSVITGGATYYFAGHHAKWTTDFGYGTNAVLAPSNITGWRSDRLTTNDGQWVARTQVQIYF